MRFVGSVGVGIDVIDTIDDETVAVRLTNGHTVRVPDRARYLRIGPQRPYEWSEDGYTWHPVGMEVHAGQRKREGRERTPALLRVRCEGKIHTLAWHYRGRVSLLSHSAKEVRALRTMKALGDETCGCLKVMSMVKGEGRIWGEWRALVRDAEEVRRERANASPRLSTPLDLEQRKTFTIGVAVEMLRKAVTVAYRTNEYRVGCRLRVGCGVAQKEIRPGIESFTGHEFGNAGRWEGFVVHATIAVPLMWLLMARAGLHHIEHMVGVAVRNWTDDTAEVLLGVLETKNGITNRPALSGRWALVERIAKEHPSIPQNEWRVAKWLEQES